MKCEKLYLCTRKQLIGSFITSMQRRNSYSDLGLMVSVSIFICILVKSSLFGFTWIGILWMLISCAYFYLSWREPSDSKLLKHSTTSYLVLSAVFLIGVLMFDKNARPEMHAFEGTGDTIQDAAIVEQEPIAPIYEMQPEDTLVSDTMSDAVIDSVFFDAEPESVPSDSNNVLPTIIQ